MSQRIRIGAVGYLNAKPLVWGLEQGLGRERIELTYDVPSALSARLAAGELDIALLPTIELARIPDLTIVPGIGITSRGRAASVLLVTTRQTIAEIDSIALDPDSCTTNALVQVLYSDGWKRVTWIPGSSDLETSLARADAAVRIGDKALFEALPPQGIAHDLGLWWHDSTRLPFVFAVWAARPGVLDRDLYMLLHASRRQGVANRERIAAEYHWEGRARPEVSLDYLTRRIFYRLGEQEMAGLTRFLGMAYESRVVAEPVALHLARFAETECETAEI